MVAVSCGQCSWSVLPAPGLQNEGLQTAVSDTVELQDHLNTSNTSARGNFGEIVVLLL